MGGSYVWSAVSRASKKQPTADASTMDAAYQAFGAVPWEILSLSKALCKMGPLRTDLSLWGQILICDEAALSLFQDCKEAQRMKNIDIIHQLREFMPRVGN
jgi:hypothetical protein